MSCTHNHYKTNGYKMSDNALKMMSRNEIVWMGMIEKTCKDCGKDVSHAKRVKVKTYNEWKE